MVNWMQFVIHLVHNTFYFTAIAWSPHRRGLLATGGGPADGCIHFWNTHSGQLLHQLDTGSQVSNVAWSQHSSELVRFLHIKVALSFVLEMVFLTKVKILFYSIKSG
jgi:WD40 repeat protein